MTHASTPSRRRIVILGGGFAGAYCAQELEKSADRDDIEIILINRSNYFVFYPLLVEACTGALNPRSAVVSIRAFCKRSRFIMATIVDVDPPTRTVTYRTGNEETFRTIEYDHLVVALGSVTQLPPVPGLKEFGYEMKSLGDAVALRDRAIQLLEIATQTEDPARRRGLLTMVVVGGGFTGVEVAGEFNAYLKSAARAYPGLHPEDVRVVLVEHGDRVLKMLSDDLSQWTADHLRRRGIELRLRESVEQITEHHCTLGDGTIVSTDTVIWCAGVAAPPVLQKVEVPRDRLGYMLTGRDGRVEGYDHIWGIGDCAVNRDGDGNAYPATAQHAVQLGIQAAANILRVFRGQTTCPIEIKSKGTLAAFGHFDAVAKVWKLKLTGFPAWFLWRTAYLIKMPTWRKRLRVAWDWTADLLFPHEFVELGVHRFVRAAKDKQS